MSATGDNRLKLEVIRGFIDSIMEILVHCDVNSTAQRAPPIIPRAGKANSSKQSVTDRCLHSGLLAMFGSVSIVLCTTSVLCPALVRDVISVVAEFMVRPVASNHKCAVPCSV
jgi:hypothetical protein